MSARPQHDDPPAVVQRLREDVDLGLRMVESLIRMGEIGAAERLVDELRAEVGGVARPQVVRIERPGKIRRSAVMAGTVAAAVGIGLSAAALVTGPIVEPAPPTRSEEVRLQPPIESQSTQVGIRDGDSSTAEAPQLSDAPPAAAEDPGSASTADVPAPDEDDSFLEPPGVDPSPPAVVPPDDSFVPGTGIQPPADPPSIRDR